MKIVPSVVAGIDDTIIKGIPEEGVEDLPAAVGRTVEGKPVIISRWSPDEHERKLIAEGGDLYLWVYGGAQPPVSITAEPPVTTTVPQTRIGLPTRQ